MAFSLMERHKSLFLNSAIYLPAYKKKLDIFILYLSSMDLDTISKICSLSGIYLHFTLLCMFDLHII